MKVLKLYTDFVEDTEELSDAEFGRLMRAVMKYAQTGELPTLNGAEKVLWRTAKRNVDMQSEAYTRICERNKSNRHSTSGDQSSPVVTSGDQSSQGKGKGKGKGNEKGIEIITPLSPKGDIPLKGGTHTKFKQPTIDEVRAYCSERHNNVNPQTFVDFYASKGWKVGNQPMRDWKACVRTWEQKDKGKPNRQRDMANTRSYSDLDAVGNDLLGG